MHRLAHHDAGSLELQRAAALERGDLAQTVDRGAERVDDAAEVAVADGDREDLAGATHDLALLDLVEVTQDHDADLAGVEVQGDAERAVLELEQLVGHHGGQAADAGDAVRGLGHGADLFTCWPTRACSPTRSAEARRGSRPDGSKAPSSLFLSLGLLEKFVDVGHGVSRRACAGLVEAAGDGAVDDVVTDLDTDAADDARGRRRR